LKQRDLAAYNITGRGTRRDPRRGRTGPKETIKKKRYWYGEDRSWVGRRSMEDH